mgnify:FL=1
MTEAQKIKTKITKLKNQTVKNMEAIGTYRQEFDATIQRYAELRIQYELLTGKWYDEGCEITEEYTNKSGAKNRRKTALYLSIETMRKELVDLENIFGLTPKGLKGIRTKGLEEKKESALDKLLPEHG